MKLDSKLLEFAEAIRSNATDAEHLLWQPLRTKRLRILNFENNN
ncbi:MULTISPECIES: DUF559 domain-containing protein [Acinetobacter]|nr:MULTISPECIES: DUF559 domain-containing protein [Acinetobacter]